MSSFRLDTYEITIGRFRKFVEAGLGTQAHPPAPGAGKHPKLARSGWDPKDNKELPASTSELMAELHCGNIPRYDDYPSLWTDTAGSGETLPMNCLTWFEAFAFCAWDGGRLPTEAEWDYAAAGGAEQRQYPWWPAHHHEELDFAGHVNLTRPKPVGSSSPATDGKWGHSDLAGNVEEWTLDLFADYYANGPGSAHGFPVPCVDCANLASPRDGERVFRLTRGGYGEAISSATSDRIPHTPSSKGMFPLSGGLIGARCARAASEP